MSRLEVTMMSDPRYTPKWAHKPAPSVNTATTQQASDVAPLGYCPFSKHPCGSACALFNVNLQRCGILAALENR